MFNPGCSKFKLKIMRNHTKIGFLHMRFRHKRILLQVDITYLTVFLNLSLKSTQKFMDSDEDILHKLRQLRQ